MESGKFEVMTWEDRVCAHVLKEWEIGKQYVSSNNDMFDEIYSMLRGERPQKNYDFQTSISINKTFQIAWTTIPYLIGKIFGSTPIVGVSSFDDKGAWQREQLLEFWHRFQGPANSQHMPFYIVMVSNLLRSILNGVGFIKKTWVQRYERKVARRGERKATINIPVEDYPNNTPIDNKDIVFDWNLQPGQSIRQGRFVIHRSVQDLGSLEKSGLYMNLDYVSVSGRPSGHDDDHSDNKSKDEQDERPTSDIYTDVEVYERVGVWRVYKEGGEWRPCLDKTDDEKEYEVKYMVVCVAKCGKDKKDVLIRFEPAEYDEINYIDTHLYLDPVRWNPMGMIEPAKDAIGHMDDVVSGIADEMWKNLFTPVIVNKYAQWDWDTMVYAPHQRWLVGGSPQDAALFVPSSAVTRDSWQTYSLLDSEVQQTTVTNAMAGAGREKTATTNVMNAQLSAGKLDFLVGMVEQTCLIPSCQMDMRFAKKFADPMTLNLIVGAAAAGKKIQSGYFRFSDWEEIYQYTPGASSVKAEHQREREIQEDIQLLQILGSTRNPGVPKIMNKLLSNILRNRNMPQDADMLDEEYFEPQSEAGNIQRIMGMMNGPSNDTGIEMSPQEAGVRTRAYPKKGLLNG